MKRLINFCLSALMTTSPAVAAPAGEMDKAFSAAFGHAAPYTAMAGGGALKKPTKLTYTPSGLVTVSPGLVALISKGKADASCGCSGALAIHYLKRKDGEFSLVKAWPAIGGAAPGGQAAAWTARGDLDGGPAILATHEEIGQDCRQTLSQIIALTPDRPVVRANLLMAVNYDPGPEPDHSPAYAVKAKLVPEQPGKNFALQYAGTWSLHVEYLRKGDVYVAKGEEAPGC